MRLSAGFLRLGSVILRLAVMVPGMDVSKEDLVKMVHRRYRGQAYSCSDLVQSYIDGSKPSSGGANSKAANHPKGSKIEKNQYLNAKSIGN